MDPSRHDTRHRPCPVPRPCPALYARRTYVVPAQWQAGRGHPLPSPPLPPISSTLSRFSSPPSRSPSSPFPPASPVRCRRPAHRTGNPLTLTPDATVHDSTVQYTPLPRSVSMQSPNAVPYRTPPPALSHRPAANPLPRRPTRVPSAPRHVSEPRVLLCSCGAVLYGTALQVFAARSPCPLPLSAGRRESSFVYFYFLSLRRIAIAIATQTALCFLAASRRRPPPHLTRRRRPLLPACVMHACPGGLQCGAMRPRRVFCHAAREPCGLLPCKPARLAEFPSPRPTLLGNHPC